MYDDIDVIRFLSFKLPPSFFACYFSESLDVFFDEHGRCCKYLFRSIQSKPAQMLSHLFPPSKILFGWKHQEKADWEMKEESCTSNV